MDVAAVRFIEKIVWEKGDGRTMSGKPTTLTDFHEKRIEGDKPCCGRSKRGKEVLQDVRLPEQGKESERLTKLFYRSLHLSLFFFSILLSVLFPK